MDDLKRALLAEAAKLGFADCRVAVAGPAPRRELYERWVAEGKHGDMAWMARNMDRRTDPRLVQPGARSVIVLVLNYYQGPPPREQAWRRLGSDLPLDKLDSTVSEAGLGDLMALAPRILKGEVRGRVVVDVNK